MATATKKGSSTARSSTRARTEKPAATKGEAPPAVPAPEPGVAGEGPVGDAYELPIIHTKVPAGLVEATFWSSLGGAALVGMISPPAAMMIGAGVLVARHRLRQP